MATLIQLRRDTAANWTAANPTLAAGEVGVETDTLRVKVGDGATAWTALGYQDGLAPVQSVAGKTGAVTLVKADVGLGNVNNTSDANKPVSTAQQTALDAKAPVTESVNTVATSGAAQTIPAPTSQSISRITLSANCTLTFPTATAGQSLTIVLIQDATGSRTVTWPAAVKWAGGTAPTLTTTAAAKDVLTFLCADGSTWLGFVAGKDMK